MGKLVLMDGHSILHRAFYGVPELTTSQGLHTNAVYGFLNIMFKILDEEQADHLAVAFDQKAPTFRHRMFHGYKATRKPMPQELYEQVSLIKEILISMEIPVLEMEGYEADDLLGTVAKRVQGMGEEVVIVSGDRDLLQLADHHIQIYLPRTTRAGTEVKRYDPAGVMSDYRVAPAQLIEVKALMGDASDNIPGVPSIGEKTATNLIIAYGSIENLKEHMQEVTPARVKKALQEHFDMAVMSKELATICTKCPVLFSYEDSVIGNLYTQEAYQWMKRLEFQSFFSRFGMVSLKKPVEKYFRKVEQFLEAEQVFAEAAQAERVGFQLLSEQGHVGGLSLCFGEKACYVIAAQGEIDKEYLCGKVIKLIRSRACGTQKKEISVLDLKPQLEYLNIDEDVQIFDAKVAGYLLNPLKETYEYDDLARDYLGMAISSRAELLGKKTVAGALREGDANAAAVACYMGYVAWKVMPKLWEELVKQQMLSLFLEMEMPLVRCLYRMETAGIRVDRKKLWEYGDRLKVQIHALEQEIYGLAGETFNINSPKQLGKMLFERMRLPHGKKTKTGYSTAAGVLEKLAQEHVIVKKILDYRQYAKLNSTYADGLNEFIRGDGRIHGTFHQTVTATGRISSAEPNLQNIPVRMELGREIRRVFVPEDGFVFVDADYSQIELRILAHMSGDGQLISAYQKAQDIHAITASQVFGTALSQVTSEQRRNAKAVNFGIVYGISAFGLSEGLSISRKEALEFIDQYFKTFPQVKDYLDCQVNKAKDDGYAATLYGRRRPIPELASSNFAKRSFGERVAMNSPIQGTAADIMKLAMISVDRELHKRGLMARIVLQVHDELLVEAPEREVDEVCEILKEKMKHAASLKVPLEVSIGCGASWFDAKA